MANPGETLAFLQESTLAYLQTEFVAGNGEQGVVFMKNKLAQTLSLLVLQTYSLTNSYSFLMALLTLCTTTEAQDGSLNALTTDLVLRLLHDLSLSLGSDVTLRSVRSKERLQRDAVVRDEIRAHHAANIAELLWKVIRDALSALTSEAPVANPSPHSLYGGAAGSLAQVAMAVVGDFATWIDIGLVINMDTVPILFNAATRVPGVSRAAAIASTSASISGACGIRVTRAPRFSMASIDLTVQLSPTRVAGPKM